MEKFNVQLLETRVDELIQICHGLIAENQMLRAKEASLIVERDTLVEKNKITCTRIETMLGRLKSLEKSS